MNILNYTRKKGSWLPKLRVGNRAELFEQVIDALCNDEFYSVNSKLTRESILEGLEKREAQRSTAMGDEIAFPHARIESLAQALFAVATLEEPVDFDGMPVRMIFLILVPTAEPTVSLKMMAQISRMMMESSMKEAVMSATTPEALREVFKQQNPKIDKPVCARDIMHQPRFSIKEDTPLATCSHLMSVNNLRSVPVVDDKHKILGEITTDQLFKYGLPEFFSKLKSVSFIAEFDPFEKYFEDERNTSVTDLMNPDARCVPLDYTLMEVVFDLAIQRFSKLYVIDAEERWVGTIDAGTVLDNVINH